MKKISNNKKGFTLVELLAVIVVLAVIILIAMPSVMNSMAKARRNSFVIEANEIIKSAQTAYSEYLMNGGSGSNICVPYSVLKEAGYIEKNDNKYAGSVLIQTSETGASTYKIWLSSGTYLIDGIEASELDNGDAIQNTTGAKVDCNKESLNILKNTDLK